MCTFTYNLWAPDNQNSEDSKHRSKHEKTALAEIWTALYNLDCMSSTSPPLASRNEKFYSKDMGTHNVNTDMNPIKPSGYYNIQKICILPTKCICGFLKINSNCFPEQH
jgi:hypothetical protein